MAMRAGGGGHPERDTTYGGEWVGVVKTLGGGADLIAGGDLGNMKGRCIHTTACLHFPRALENKGRETNHSQYQTQSPREKVGGGRILSENGRLIIYVNAAVSVSW